MHTATFRRFGITINVVTDQSRPDGPVLYKSDESAYRPISGFSPHAPPFPFSSSLNSKAQ